MNIPRHYYQPTETQRAEVKARAELLRQTLKQRREQREARERIEREAIPELMRHGFSEKQAREIVLLDAGLKVGAA